MGFSVLDNAVARKRAEHEQTRQQTLARLDDALCVLAQRYAFGEVFLFGSVTKPGAFDADSDVDLAVSGLGDGYWRFMGELAERLRREVDVVDLDTSRFAERIRRKGRRWTPPH